MARLHQEREINNLVRDFEFKRARFRIRNSELNCIVLLFSGLDSERKLSVDRRMENGKLKVLHFR